MHGARWRGARLALAAAMLGAGLLAGACSSAGSTPQATASMYLGDWARRDWPGMRALIADPPADFSAVNAAAVAGLSVRRASYQAGRLRTSGDTASEPVAEHLVLGGIGTITVRTVLRLTSTSAGWLVKWSPATIAPQLKPG